ncbi:MAG: glycosyltransferase family 61 protein [Trichodesmium sp. MAG_R03]|nr:glycosyltransferase family 61 protein [Trichodesmium sp. MAG_R03]
MLYWSDEKNTDLIINDNLKDLARQNGWLFEVVEKSMSQIFQPSKTIEEDIIYAIQDWGKILNNKNDQELKDIIIPRENNFYHLYCVTSSEMGETFRCTMPNATILEPNGLVLTSDFEIITQSVMSEKLKLDFNLEKIKEAINNSEKLLGTYVSLLSDYSLNYAHWLMDGLPKLALLESLKQELKFIIPKNSPSYIIDSLKLLGIKEQQLIKIQHPCLVVEKLILIHGAQKNGRVCKKYILKIRNKLLQAINDNNKPDKLIYISRSNYTRKIINESEILPIIKKYNFEILRCEELSFREQINIFSQAQVLLGPHGAGIYNQIFCNRGAIIIEIYNKQYWNHSSRIISSFLNHNHWHIFGENVAQDYQTYVEPLKLDKVLSYAINDYI